MLTAVSEIITSSEESATLPSCPDIERDLVGAVLCIGNSAFHTANLKSDDFYIHRWRFFWEACEAIVAAGDTIDNISIEKELIRARHWEDVTCRESLEQLMSPDTSFHVEVNARTVRDRAERRRIVIEAEAQANETIRRARDLSIPLPETTADPWAKEWKTLHDAFAPRPPQEWAVEDLIQLPSLTCWYGNPGDLKTMLLSSLALSVASSFPFLLEAPWKPGGRTFAVNPYPVLWLDFDNGLEMTLGRFEALARAMDISPDLPSLHFISMPSPWLILDNPDSVAYLVQQIRKFGARFVVIDNLGTVKGSAKENTDEMIPVMSTLRQIASTTKSSVNFIHHETKNGALTARRGDRLRGHSSIEGALDLALLVEREPDSDTITIHSTKTRGVDVPPFSAAWTYTHKQGTAELATAMFYGLPCENKKSPQAIREAVRDILSEGPALKTQLAKAVHTRTEGIGVNRIRDCIERMIKEKEIMTTSGGKTSGELCTLA